MRKPFIAGNWKMNNTIAESTQLAVAVREGLTADSANKVEVALIPHFLAIPAVAGALSGSPIRVGGQDVYFEKSGAFTGEISPYMLADAGCAFALVGHSERRHVVGEPDSLVRKKLEALLDAGLEVILCVGEQIQERKAGQTEQRLDTQIRAAMSGLDIEQVRRITVAYEPVWAIGTGMTATTAQAQDAHQFIRNLIGQLYDNPTADAVRIQYGGSVKPENAGQLLAQSDVDGALVGGASLSAPSFLGIIDAS